MSSKSLHLVCNAHLDPVWLWSWEEGAAEALSTFRTAARLCLEFEDFVFCHNESLLYKWIEEYDPRLFADIQRLVREKRWHIMGGWFLQPDCNMPCGESFVRQILVGKTYFEEKFGVEPKTAVNFDPFGHSRGLVQILKKSGYDSYVFCRPDPKELDLPAENFLWTGYDGSEVLAHRAGLHYNSERGKAGEKVKKWLKSHRGSHTGVLFWGIGDHGGGPSREDLISLEKIIKTTTERRILHSVPEAYFERLDQYPVRIPRWENDLNPWAVGCYTSMARVKQAYRLLENSYFMTEKMATHAALEGLMDYPRLELREALEDLLFCQFHDVLPGSSTAEVEEDVLRKAGHGMEILSRIKLKAFFGLLGGQLCAEEEEFLIFVYNPHPFSATETVSCEFQPLEPNPDPDSFWMPELKDENGLPVPFQLEKESSNVAVDQRKRIVFLSELKASQMTRLSCRLRSVSSSEDSRRIRSSPFEFETETLQVAVDPTTGLVNRYRAHGEDYLGKGSFRLLVCEDSPDPWGMLVRSFNHVVGEFCLMSPRQSARFSGVGAETLAPVRVIEDGPVRTVVEAVFRFNCSFARLTYSLPKRGNELEVNLRVLWNEKDRMLKLSVPTVFEEGSCCGQVAYGIENFGHSGEERVAQQWIAALSSDRMKALTVINEGTYGFDNNEGEIRVSLLRSPAYAGHPVGTKPIVPQDRFQPRIDLGERKWSFWICGGSARERLSKIGREAQMKNERPMALSCYPSGAGQEPSPGILLSDGAVQLASFKRAEKENKVILRLFEPTGSARSTRVDIPALDLSFGVSLGKFEIKTFACDLKSKRVVETDLLERELDE